MPKAIKNISETRKTVTFQASDNKLQIHTKKYRKNKDEIVYVRITKKTRAFLDVLGKAMGLNLSTTIRVILEASEEQGIELKKVAYINRIRNFDTEIVSHQLEKVKIKDLDSSKEDSKESEDKPEEDGDLVKTE